MICIVFVVSFIDVWWVFVFNLLVYVLGLLIVFDVWGIDGVFDFCVLERG